MQNPGAAYQVSLEGQVCWASRAQKAFAFLDASGGLILKVDSLPQLPQIGQRLRLTGLGTISSAGGILTIGTDSLMVDNDSIHTMREHSGAVYLEAGRIPIQLEWFNGTGRFGLEVDIEGPDFLRRKIRNSELFRGLGQTNGQTPGLDYRCYEGWWTDLPDFSGLKPVKTGTVDNIDLGIRTRSDGVGLEFAGFFEVIRPGLYKFYLTSDDGSRLHLGRTRVQADVLSQDELPVPHHLFVGQVLDENEDDSWSWLEGKVTDVWTDEDGLRMEVSVGRSRIEVGITGPVSWAGPELLNKFVRVTGFCQGAYDSDGLKTPNLLLAPDSRQLEIIETLPIPTTTNGNPAGLPVLTSAAKVHRLKREEAQLGYPVNIQGVVTGRSPVGDGFTLQDSTRGLFVEYTNPVQVGEFVEVAGQTDPGNYAPMLVKSTVRHLGKGRLPEPLRPTWDQLMNGSLTSQFVEIEGIVTGTSQNGVQLIAPGGPVHLRFIEVSGSEAIDLEVNTLVKIRGGLHVEWREKGQMDNLEGLWIWDPKVTVEAPAKADLLSLPYKTPQELLLFDFQASSLQRIRMSGQIVHVAADVCCMMAGNSGVRFVAQSFQSLIPGDIVNVAGNCLNLAAPPPYCARRKRSKPVMPRCRKRESFHPAI